MQVNARRTQFEILRRAIKRKGFIDRELTAQEIHEVAGEVAGLSSPHEAATVLGLHRDEPGFTVVEDSPYRYVFS